MVGGPAGAAAGAMLPTAIGTTVGLPARMGANSLQRQGIDRLIATILNQGSAVPRLPSNVNPGLLAYYASRPGYAPLGTPSVNPMVPTSR